MIIKKIRLKNVLSYGNKWTELNLNNQQSNLITGKNGEGKSSITNDALYFALSGKAYRNIKKSELVNSTNKKNLVVELFVENNGNDFKIVRGIKPNIFEIWKNGELIEEEARVTDYQKLLEQLLNFDPNIFTKTVLITNSFYKPFLRLPAGEKREFIENILNIQIFSEMRDVLKRRNSVLNEEIRDNQKELEILKSKKELIVDLNKKKKKETDQALTELESDTKNKLKKIDIDYNKKVNNLDKEKESRLLELRENSSNKKDELKKELENTIKKIENNYTNKKDKLKYDYIVLQEETEENYNKKKKELEENVKSLDLEIVSLEEDINNFQDELKKYSNIITLNSKKTEKLDRYKEKLWSISEQIKTLEKEREFFEKNSNCPQCKQKISKEYSEDIKLDFDKKISKLKKSKKKGTIAVQKLEELVEETKLYIKDKSKLEEKITNNKHKISNSEVKKKLTEEQLNNFDTDFQQNLEKLNKTYKRNLKELEENKNIRIEEEKINFKRNIENLVDYTKGEETINNEFDTRLTELKLSKKEREQDITSNYLKRKKELSNITFQDTGDIDKNIEDEEVNKKELEKKEKYYKVINTILSDKGIKTYIIRKYMLVFNNFVNKYLEILHAKYRIVFDENLNNKIALRNYEKLSYNSFSAGERQRCDMALLFAFLELSKLKESGSSCNLLILDEIADSAMDADGIDGLISILNHLKNEGLTIFTISHRDIKNYFDSVYTIKKNQFSYIEKQ